MSGVTVRIRVYENDVERAAKSIRYFEGQPYAVKIDTPDGVDVEEHFTAGRAPVMGESPDEETTA